MSRTHSTKCPLYRSQTVLVGFMAVESKDNWNQLRSNRACAATKSSGHFDPMRERTYRHTLNLYPQLKTILQ